MLMMKSLCFEFTKF